MKPNRETLRAIRAGRTCIMQRGRGGLCVGWWHVIDSLGNGTRRVVGAANNGRTTVYQIGLDYCINERNLPDSCNPWAGEPSCAV